MLDLSIRIRFSKTAVALAALLAGLSAPAFAGQPATVTYLYWAQTGAANSGIWRSLATGELPERLIAPMNGMRSVEIEPTTDTMFVGTEGSGDAVLWRTDLSGGNRVAIVEGLGIIWSIEIDGAAGKVYWTARTTGSSNQISRADFDGSSLEPLLTAPLSNALGLDPSAGKMYFGSGTQLHRANLDGTGEESLLNASGEVKDIEVDATQGKLYYSTSGDLDRCELDGTGCKVIGPGADDFEIVGSALYYERSSNGGLWQADLDGGNPQLLWDAHLSGSWDIHPDTLEIYEPSANLWRSALDGSNRVGVIGVAGELLHDVAVDPAGARFYFSGEGDESVVQATLDGRTLVPIGGDEGIWSYIRGLDRDPVSGQLFWASIDANTNQGGDDAIGVMNADGSDAHLIVTALGDPHDVAVDAVNGKVYWTDRIEKSISRANFDGTMVETILPGLGEEIRGIAVDPANGKVYWTDHEADELWWADLDGGNAAALPPVVTNPHDVAVDAAAGYLYWVEGIANSDNLTAKIRRSNLDGTGDVDVLTGLPARTRDLTVVEHAPLFIFFDGFESGDTSAWSSP